MNNEYDRKEAELIAKIKENPDLEAKEFIGFSEDFNISLLSVDDLIGNKKLEVFDKNGIQTTATDLSLLTGTYLDNNNNISYKTKSYNGDTGVWAIDRDGYDVYDKCDYYDNFRNSIRPIIKIEDQKLFDIITSDKIIFDTGVSKVKFGEYPQYAPDENTQKILEEEYQKNNLKQTGKNFTLADEDNYGYFVPDDNIHFKEYEYSGKKYIRARAVPYYPDSKYHLSNNSTYKGNEKVWLEVTPIEWLIDNKSQSLISDKGLLSGIRFSKNRIEHDFNFEDTELSTFLRKKMLPEMMRNNKKILNQKDEKKYENSEYNELKNKYKSLSEINKALHKLENIPVLNDSKSIEEFQRQIDEFDNLYNQFGSKGR